MKYTGIIAHATMKKALSKYNIQNTVTKINFVKHVICNYLCEVSVRADSFEVLFYHHVDSMKLEVVL